MNKEKHKMLRSQQRPNIRRDNAIVSNCSRWVRFGGELSETNDGNKNKINVAIQLNRCTHRVVHSFGLHFELHLCTIDSVTSRKWLNLVMFICV